MGEPTMEQLMETADAKLLRIELADWLAEMPEPDGLNERSFIREMQLDGHKRRRAWDDSALLYDMRKLIRKCAKVILANGAAAQAHAAAFRDAANAMCRGCEQGILRRDDDGFHEWPDAARPCQATPVHERAAERRGTR